MTRRGRSTVRAVGGLTLANLAIVLQGLLIAPLQARTLGPSGRGLLAAATVPAVFLTALAGLGLPLAANYLTAARRGHPGEVAGTTAALLFGFSLCVCLGLTPFISKLDRHSSNVHTVLLVTVISTPFAIATYGPGGVLAGLEQWRVSIAVRLIPPVTVVCGGLALFALGDLTVLTMGLTTVAGGIICTLPILAARRLYTPVRFSFVIARDSLNYGAKSWLGNLANLANARLDQILLIPLVPTRDLGLYAVAVNMSGMLTLVASAVATVSTTQVAEAGSVGYDRAISTIRSVFALAIIGTVVLACLTPLLLPALFGYAFRPAILLTELLLPGAFALACALVVTGCANALGFPLYGTYGEIVALTFTIPGLIIFLPQYGVVAAAVVSSVAYSMSLSAQVALLSRRLAIPLASIVIPRNRDLLAIMRIVRRLNP